MMPMLTLDYAALANFFTLLFLKLFDFRYALYFDYTSPLLAYAYKIYNVLIYFSLYFIILTFSFCHEHWIFEAIISHFTAASLLTLQTRNCIDYIIYFLIAFRLIFIISLPNYLVELDILIVSFDYALIFIRFLSRL
jgi:hypothetical protein